MEQRRSSAARKPTKAKRAAANNVPVLSDGQLVFRVSRSGGQTEHRIDLLLLKLTCESCEDAHHLEVRDGRLIATPEFLQDLASRIESLGVEDCTPTMAWQIWVAATEEMGRLKNSFSEMPS